MFYFIMFFLILLLSLYFLISIQSKLMFIEWSFLNIPIELSFLINKVSMSFFSVVLIVATIIFYYSNYYMAETIKNKRFKWLFILFLLSMIMVIFSSSMLSLFIGWDGLGVSSYCLVIFFMNWKSRNAGLITILSNRVGDSILLMSLFFFFMNFSLSSFNFEKGMSFLLSFMFLLVMITKSAQFPFSSWLPLAMAAPTPISALVHSSTLVTAGIFLLIQWFDFMNTKILLFIFFCISLTTLVMSGLQSVFETDLKKIVAFSTLNQLSFIFISFVFNNVFLSLFHLMAHAIFKSLLFLNVGSLIHLNFNSQDFRLYKNIENSNLLILISISLSVFNLMGLIFLSGFYSKDLILEKMFSYSLSFCLVFILYLSMVFTFIYSFRVLSSIVYLTNVNMVFLNFSKSMGLSLFFLTILSIFFGNFIFWNFLPLNLIVTSIEMKFFIVLFLFFFLVQFKFKFNLNFVLSLFLLNMMSTSITYNLSFLLKSFKNYFENGWLEIYQSQIVNYNFFTPFIMNFMTQISFFWKKDLIFLLLVFLWFIFL